MELNNAEAFVRAALGCTDVSVCDVVRLLLFHVQRNRVVEATGSIFDMER